MKNGVLHLSIGGGRTSYEVRMLHPSDTGTRRKPSKVMVAVDGDTKWEVFETALNKAVPTYYCAAHLSARMWKKFAKDPKAQSASAELHLTRPDSEMPLSFVTSERKYLTMLNIDLPPASIKIILKSIKGTAFHLDCSPDDDVRVLKKRFYARYSIPPDWLRMLHFSIQLFEDGSKLRDYRIQDGSVLLVVLKIFIDDDVAARASDFVPVDWKPMS
mmetsp:Transcript_25326/g.60998  ORF Transcript_25326/g.60998 Transcript_25326/m.60998 type:complete len:216 (+) Transcript_25326:1-648(+)